MTNYRNLLQGDSLGSYCLQHYDRMKKKLIAAARKAARRAQSYRRFCVGAAILCLEPKAPWRMRIVTGYNIKRTGNGRKLCAEQMAIINCKLLNLIPIAIAVVGKAQEDGTTGLLAEVLYPCDNCRFSIIINMLFCGNTPVLTAPLQGYLPDGSLYREECASEILIIHVNAAKCCQ